MKVDVEKAELEVLRGIAEDDWPKIWQIAIEVHDLDGRVAHIRELLERHGFTVASEQIEELSGTALYDLYAVRPGGAQAARRQGPAAAPEPAWRNGEQLVASVRASLETRLPEYMVPSAFVLLDGLPLTRNGKVNRRALAKLEGGLVGRERAHVEPRTPTEERVATLWAKLLRRDRIGTEDNFFDLGGHSLLATQLVSRLREAFAIPLSLRHLFEQPTVAGLARQIDAARHAATAFPSAPIPGGARREEALPLSFAQERLWLLDQMQPESALYNIPLALEIDGRLAVPALAGSLREIVSRHEALRTVFAAHEPLQRVRPATPVELPVIDLAGLPGAARDAVASALAGEEAVRPFDLQRGPLLRATLLALGSESHILLATMHHIASDGWSLDILVREMTSCYRALVLGEQPALPALPIQYPDFAQWQREHLSGESLERQARYWHERLRGAPELKLPLDRSRPAVPGNRGGVQSIELRREVNGLLRTLQREEGATAFMVLLAGFLSLLSRHGGRSDLSVGTPASGRDRVELEGLIGFFVNTLVLRVSLAGDPTFREILGGVRETVLEAHAHQDLPFEKLQELAPDRGSGRAPLFQVMFDLQNRSREALRLPGLAIRPLEVASTTAKFDLTLFMAEREGGLRGDLEYRSELFDGTTARRLLVHFERLLEAAVSAPHLCLSELPILSAAERLQLLREWNDTAALRPTVCVHELFEVQAAEAPDAVALVAGRNGEEILTYGGLERRANRLAGRLRGLGVAPEVVVALHLARGLEMVTAVLAVLKAGGAYLPLDRTHPMERSRSLLAESRAAVLLGRDLPATLATLPELAVLDLADGGLPVDTPAAVRPASGARTGNLAYILYTSGSTGRPKGIMVSHGGVVSYLRWCLAAYEVAAGEGAPVHSPLGFDLTITSLFAPLVAGRPVVLLEEAAGIEPLAEALARSPGFSLVKLTPAHLEMLSRSLPAADVPGCARRLVVGGEALLWSGDLDLWRRQGTRVVNEYGPTETVVGCATYELPDPGVPGRPGGVSGGVPIGRPIANARLHVLDEDLRLVPLGVAGELYVGGAGLARGYLGQPDRTAERFVPDPFSEVCEAGGRLYRSGDRVRYLADGSLEFLGRTDHQVKLRGFRIEPAEIEAALVAAPGVREAVVILQGEGTECRRLVAYVAGEPEAALRTEDLRGVLQQRLPAYMVPAAFVILSSLPLTANGKVDRAALPMPDGGRRPASGVLLAPRDPLELALARVWEELLGLSPVGVRDDFFRLGGHSLLAVRLLAQIERLFARRLPLAQLMQNPTVEGLAARLRQGGPLPEPVLVTLQEGSGRPLFLVHPVGGGVLCYADLVRRLGPGRPVYGLQRPEEEAGLDDTLEAMAARYLAEIRSVQPHGPYRLGGWSMGGLVAFEMACQLTLLGEAVELLALLDPTPPTSPPAGAVGPDSRGRLLADFAEDLGIPSREIAARLAETEFSARIEDEERLWPQLLAAARELGLAAPDLGPEWLRRRFALFRANVAALEAYRPSPYAGSVLLLAAEPERVGDPAEPWLKLAGTIEVRRLAGSHYEIVREPQVGALAEQLDALISACEGAGWP